MVTKSTSPPRLDDLSDEEAARLTALFYPDGHLTALAIAFLGLFAEIDPDDMERIRCHASACKYCMSELKDFLRCIGDLPPDDSVN